MTYPKRLLRRALLLFVGVLSVPACARVLSHHDLAPNGLTRPEHAFRIQLESGRADSALFLMASASDKKSRAYSPGDELLRSLYTGVLAHYAGRWEQSAQELESRLNFLRAEIIPAIS